MINMSSYALACLALWAGASAARPAAAQECDGSRLDSGAEELDESSALQEVILLQVAHDLTRSGVPSSRPLAGDGTSKTVHQDSAMSSSSVPKELMAEQEATKVPDAASDQQRGLAQVAEVVSEVRSALNETLPVPSEIVESEEASTWDKLKVILSNPIKDLWENRTESLSEEDAKAGGTEQSDRGLGAWILLIAAMSLWTFLLVECCKGGIHWGNTEQFDENRSAEQALKPKVPVTGGQKDVASVAQRAKEIQRAQTTQRGCC